MPRIRDFRHSTFGLKRVESCGRYVGSKLYWKLYAVENAMRVVIHSVLTAQVGANWWSLTVDPAIASKASRFRTHYAARPQNASPGLTDIHLVFLSDLTEILRANSHLFLPIIPDTNTWIATLEAIRVPRNLVGHMNFPNAFDKAAIDSAYAGLPLLIKRVTDKGLAVVTPK